MKTKIKNCEILPENFQISKSEDEWKKELGEKYEILRGKGTEAPFTGTLLYNKEKGIYYCGACGNELFSSETKYDSGSGWPSFFKPESKDKIKEEEIEKIVEYFTEKLYSHTYFIGRKEAKEELGVKSVVEADAELSKLMSDLYVEYSAEMELQNAVWNPENELGPNTSQAKKEYKVAFVESEKLSRTYKLTMDFRRQQVMVQQGGVQVPQEQIASRVVEQGWK